MVYNISMDHSKVTNPAAKAFLNQFFIDRGINREFYERVPEDKFDYRIVDTSDKKSDSPRESLAHQIETEIGYIKAIELGELKFGVEYEDLSKLKQLSKQELLNKMQKVDQQLIDILADDQNCNKLITVPWSKTPIPAVTMIWSLDSHEILHIGWNLAVMDHLGIERFPKLKQMWG